jgi:hypothetical protein
MENFGSIVFAGCARDAAEHLPAVLRNIDRLSSLFTKSAYLVCENDSVDSTKAILADWGPKRSGFELIDLKGLGEVAQRTLRLECARNVLVELIRTSKALSAADWVFLLDFDEVNAREFELEQFSRALAWIGPRPEVAGIFPNQINGPYYDMWALRHETYCPGDLLEEAFDYRVAHACSDEAAFAATAAKRSFSLPIDAEPLMVDSAFGGFGIYRMAHFLRNKNPYLGQKVKVIRHKGKETIARWQLCEHVHFHAGLRNLGCKLFVVPYLVNFDTSHERMVPTAFRSLLF